MKTLLLYFTGTYNTRYLSNMVKDELLKKQHDVEMIEVDINTPVCSLEQYNNIFISYPIYAFNIPDFFYKYLKKVKFIKGKKYIIYKNSGETFKENDSSSRKLIKLFKKYNIEDYSEYHFIMPYNIHFKFDDEFVYQCLKMDKLLLKVMIYNFENNIIHKLDSSFYVKTMNRLFEIQKIGGFVNSFFYKVDYKKCSNCYLCIKNCPTNNIVLKNEKIKFKHNCLMCMRCSFFCPKDAIKIGFLKKWKVNGKYNFKEIEKIKDYEKSTYLDEQTDKFYRCFRRSFKKIEEEYEEIINE